MRGPPPHVPPSPAKQARLPPADRQPPPGGRRPRPCSVPGRGVGSDRGRPAASRSLSNECPRVAATASTTGRPPPWTPRPRRFRPGWMRLAVGRRRRAVVQGVTVPGACGRPCRPPTVGEHDSVRRLSELPSALRPGLRLISAISEGPLEERTGARLALERSDSDLACSSTSIPAVPFSSNRQRRAQRPFRSASSRRCEYPFLGSRQSSCANLAT